MLHVGDVIVPGRECGKGRGQYVWMSATSRTSWGPNVYPVAPVGDLEEARGWYRAPRAVVVDEAWCNHDAVAVRNGVCECGAVIDQEALTTAWYAADCPPVMP